jgi:hypothetical protein
MDEGEGASGGAVEVRRARDRLRSGSGFSSRWKTRMLGSEKRRNRVGMWGGGRGCEGNETERGKGSASGIERRVSSWNVREGRSEREWGKCRFRDANLRC